MKRLSLILSLAATAALLLFGPVTPADAATIKMCAPGRTGAALGPGRVTAPGSGTTYSTDPRGCVLVASADIGDFRAKGFVVDAPFGSVVATGMTSSASGNRVTIPAGAYIETIIVQETSGSAVPGGVKFGTTNGGSDVVAGLQMAASSVNATSGNSLLKKVFSSTVPTILYADAASNYNLISSSLNITVVYGYF